MANEFLKSYDDLLAAILTDYSNLDPAPDTSAGSIVFIKSACLASALWGLYWYMDHVSNQIFPDTADSDNLNHHGSIRGLTRSPAETDQEFLDRLLTLIRHPPAGGNTRDWAYWTQFDSSDLPIYATGVAGLTGIGVTGLWVESATVIPNAQGPGTVDVVIQPNDIAYLGSTGMENLRILSEASVEVQRPITATDYRVMAVVKRTGVVSITVTSNVTGTVLDTQAMVDEITSMFNSLKPGDSVTRAKLSAACVNNGADNVTILAPGVDLVPSSYEILSPTSITVVQV